LAKGKQGIGWPALRDRYCSRDETVFTWKISSSEYADRHLMPNYLMHILKVICLTIFELAKQVWTFPATVAANLRKRRRLTEVSEGEAERLDRLRNPSKYLGKES
jgi:hypothetical protein